MHITCGNVFLMTLVILCSYSYYHLQLPGQCASKNVSARKIIPFVVSTVTQERNAFNVTKEQDATSVNYINLTKEATELEASKTHWASFN